MWMALHRASWRVSGVIVFGDFGIGGAMRWSMSNLNVIDLPALGNQIGCPNSQLLNVRSTADILENHDWIAALTEGDSRLPSMSPLFAINIPSEWGCEGDLITELDALAEISAKASVALSLLECHL